VTLESLDKGLAAVRPLTLGKRGAGQIRDIRSGLFLSHGSALYIVITACVSGEIGVSSPHLGRALSDDESP
jgi:hypothetical protein